ncbi:type 11 methyltransferase [Calothrix parasitica NIES-267]|uniref:Type 11 methyltransferase n=1 Tax=Calothrix parasitica NIES-267 TaxID=1973488 RepID=A0A1Z4LM78_9CYAN|nr:type 11 methyltransferase [Calothrix parasitica NIES-267]
MALYDKIGKNYGKTRRSDPRIARKLLDILESFQASTIVDIGAGTGSYAFFLAEYGYEVIAVEPSATMRNQAISHPAIEWIDGYAENLPLSDGAAEAAIIMLAFHHFQDYRQALREVHRVVGNGQIILFTYDPEMISSFWLTKYFPSLIKDVESTFISIPELSDEIHSITGNGVNVSPFRLPHNLSDSFAAVGWARPELYLDINIRNGISSFAKIDGDEVNVGVLRLQEDLETGRWDKEYGYLRKQKQYDVGYRFVVSRE